MEPACVRHSQLPGATALSLDFLYHFDRVSRFYAFAPLDGSSFSASARRVSYPEQRRAAMVAALSENNPGNPLLRDLARPGTVAVVTGQQVGLYGGPCYTVYKALTAVHIARRLTDSGTPAVPVFWLATEDHDFAEIDHAWTFDSAREPRKLSATGQHRSGQPVGGVAIQSVDSIEMEAVARHYRPGRTFGEAFQGLLTELLDGYPVLFLDPMRASIRQIAGPFLADAAARSKRLGERLLDRNHDLQQAGYHAQVLFEGKDATLFFGLEDGLRRSLKGKELDSWQARPEALSPNALLRPVMQDYLLPTAVMVGGPAELAYLAQSAVLYDELLGRMPCAVPRAGFTLFDARAGKLMERYGFRLPDLLDHEAAVRQRIAAKLSPPEVKQAFSRAAGTAESALSELAQTLRSFDPTLEEALSRSRKKIAFQLEKTVRKIDSELLRRSERESADAAYLLHTVYPHRHLQERFYSILPFVAEHGPALIQRIYDNIHWDCPDHHVLPV